MIVWLRGSSDRAPPCRADVVDRHPDCELAGCAQPRPGQMWCGLIHPAFPVQTGTIDHLGRGQLLHDLDLGDGRTVPLTGRLVPCLRAAGHCTARRLDDGATTSIGCGLGLAIDGGLPVVRLACADDGAARRRTKAAQTDVTADPSPLEECAEAGDLWVAADQPGQSTGGGESAHASAHPRAGGRWGVRFTAARRKMDLNPRNRSTQNCP